MYISVFVCCYSSRLEEYVPSISSTVVLKVKFMEEQLVRFPLPG